jgi:hypothetical protein
MRQLLDLQFLFSINYLSNGVCGDDDDDDGDDVYR